MNAPILIVEDNRHDVLLAERALSRAHVGAPLQVVTDGEAAMQYLSGEAPFTDRLRFRPPALVLLDLNLPRRSGHEVLSWIREAPAIAGTGYPVVVLTTSERQEDREMAARSGAAGYLVKPLVEEAVVKMLHEMGLDDLLPTRDPPPILPSPTPPLCPPPA
jgi:CheY-like chemotaxis protein